MGFNKENKHITKRLFMLYLVMTLILFLAPPPVEASEYVGVTKATGDLTVGIPLIEVPGTGGFNHEIMLSYSGGDGVTLFTSPTEVGLGWALNNPSIVREVRGLPDDYYGTEHFVSELELSEPTNFWDFKYEDTFTRSVPWWQKAIFFVVAIVLVAASLFLAKVTGGATSGFTKWLVVTLVSVAASFATTLILGLVSLALSDIDFNTREMLRSQADDLTSVSWSNAFTLASAGLGEIEALSSLNKLMDNLGGIYNIVSFVQSLPDLADSFKMLGSAGDHELLANRPLVDNSSSLYNSFGMFYQEPYRGAVLLREDIINLSAVSYRKTDYGTPDIYTVSGPYSGQIFPFEKDFSNGALDVSLPGEISFIPDLNAITDDIRITARNDLLQMRTGVNPTTECLLAFDYAFCSEPRNKYVEHYIDQIVIESKDGHRLVYGDPSVPGSIVRMHRQASSTLTSVRTGSSEGFMSRESSFEYTHHPVEWKLVAILSADYEGPAYPLSNEDAITKGHWIAFTYDYKYNLTDPSSQCAFLSANSIPAIHLWEYYGDHPDNADESIMRTWSGQVFDISYLSEIVTPTHKAVFEYSDRLDAPGSIPWSDHYLGNNKDSVPELGVNYGFHNFGFKFTECEEEDAINPTYNSLHRPESTACGVDTGISETLCSNNLGDYQGIYEQKIDSITLYARESDDEVSKVYFNKDKTIEEIYYLRQGFKPIGTIVNGEYTLRTVTLCGFESGKECLEPYVFNYYNYNEVSS